MGVGGGQKCKSSGKTQIGAVKAVVCDRILAQTSASSRIRRENERNPSPSAKAVKAAGMGRYPGNSQPLPAFASQQSIGFLVAGRAFGRIPHQGFAGPIGRICRATPLRSAGRSSRSGTSSVPPLLIASHHSLWCPSDAGMLRRRREVFGELLRQQLELAVVRDELALLAHEHHRRAEPLVAFPTLEAGPPTP